MTRIPYRAPPVGTDAIADAIRLRRGARGLSPLDKALLNAPEIANGWNTLLGAVRTKNSLPDDVRELMILRVAARNSAAFEWLHHAHVGVDAGLTAKQLTIIRDLATPLPLPSAPAPLSAFQAAALRFADASTWSVHVPSRIVDELKLHLSDDQQLLEAAAVPATYNMVSRLLVALDVGEMGADCLPLPETKQEEHFVEVAEGVKLYVKTAIRTDDEGAPWLVFVNSLMTNCSMWDAALPRLSKKYNLLTFDQRGHGKSSIPTTPCNLIELASDIAKILEILAVPTPIRALIGVSQGGATSLAFSLSYADLFTSLIVCDSKATSPATNTKAWEERIAIARAQGMGVLADKTIPRWFPSRSEFGNEGRRAALVRDMIEGTQVEGFAASARALQGYDLSPTLVKSLTGKKILLMAGEHDGELPKSLEQFRTMLVGEGVDASLEIIKGCGHLPMIDGTQDWLDAVEKFLQ